MSGEKERIAIVNDEKVAAFWLKKYLVVP